MGLEWVSNEWGLEFGLPVLYTIATQGREHCLSASACIKAISIIPLFGDAYNVATLVATKLSKNLGNKEFFSIKSVNTTSVVDKSENNGIMELNNKINHMNILNTNTLVVNEQKKVEVELEERNIGEEKNKKEVRGVIPVVRGLGDNQVTSGVDSCTKMPIMKDNPSDNAEIREFVQDKRVEVSCEEINEKEIGKIIEISTKHKVLMNRESCDERIKVNEVRIRRKEIGKKTINIYENNVRNEEIDIREINKEVTLREQKLNGKEVN
ncbi:hypothetical protein M0802_015069 [Mischocyttarus mexicanus]|nr:hypothetical protein M0802_015069 [Mischocyttarus mexicanus]